MPHRLVAIGDSTVEGLEDVGPDGAYIGWADRFARHLDAVHPGMLYANLAVRGQTVREVRRTQLGPALALAPDVAVVVAGVNDVLRPRFDRAAVREDLFAIHSALTLNGAQVLTFTIPGMERVAPLAVFLRRRLKFLDSVILQCHERYGSIVVDFASEPAASHPALWHTDRLHANSEGHRRIAAALAERVGQEVQDWRTQEVQDWRTQEVLDWRTEPPAVPRSSRTRLALTEAGWVGSHLAPWAWDQLRGRAAEQGLTCKRPNLLPLT